MAHPSISRGTLPFERGKYLNVWKPEDGTWKIHANVWNTNASPAATAERPPS